MCFEYVLIALSSLHFALFYIIKQIPFICKVTFVLKKEMFVSTIETINSSNFDRSLLVKYSGRYTKRIVENRK